MKKNLAVFVFVLFLMPSLSFAQSVAPDQQSSLLALIASLTQQVQVLEAQLLTIESQTATSTVIAASVATTTPVDCSITYSVTPNIDIAHVSPSTATGITFQIIIQSPCGPVRDVPFQINAGSYTEQGITDKPVALGGKPVSGQTIFNNAARNSDANQVSMTRQFSAAAGVVLPITISVNEQSKEYDVKFSQVPEYGNIWN